MIKHICNSFLIIADLLIFNKRFLQLKKEYDRIMSLQNGMGFMVRSFANTLSELNSSIFFKDQYAESQRFYISQLEVFIESNGLEIPPLIYNTKDGEPITMSRDGRGNYINDKLLKGK